MFSYVELESMTVWLVRKLFDTVGAVMVVTTASVETAEGEALDVEKWRKSKDKNDSDENMFAPRRASAQTVFMRCSARQERDSRVVYTAKTAGCAQAGARRGRKHGGTFIKPRLIRGPSTVCGWC